MVDGGNVRQWWYEQDGRATGPVDAAEVLSLVESGVLGMGTRVKATDSSGWTTIGELTADAPLGGQPQVPFPPPTAVAPNFDAQLAGSGIRFGTAVLEGVLVSLTLWVGWIVWSVIVWPRGLTPAKQLTGLRVVDIETGEPATRDRMIVRELVARIGLLAATLGVIAIVSAFMILFGNSRQAVWDRIAMTVVVDDSTTEVSSARREQLRLRRRGCMLIAAALCTFVGAGFSAEGTTELDEQTPAILMMVVAAGLAVGGIASLVKAAYRGRDR